jgi:hypothetical protein
LLACWLAGQVGLSDQQATDGLTGRHLIIWYYQKPNHQQPVVALASAWFTWSTWAVSPFSVLLFVTLPDLLADWLAK